MKAGYDWDITLVEIRKGVEVLGKIQVYSLFDYLCLIRITWLI